MADLEKVLDAPLARRLTRRPPPAGPFAQGPFEDLPLRRASRTARRVLADPASFARLAVIHAPAFPGRGWSRRTSR